MKITVVAVVGAKGSGKTATIEVLTKGLTSRGYSIAAAKHISEEDFSIDINGKDTWRFAQSGAAKIVSVAHREVATIERIDTTSLSLEQILKRCASADLVLLEGFRKLVASNLNVPKIVAVRSVKEAYDASKTFHPILAFTGLSPLERLSLKIPYINLLENRSMLVDVVDKHVRKKWNVKSRD